MHHVVLEDQPPRVPRLNFDTRGFAPGDRRDAWVDNMGVFFDLSSPDGARLGLGINASIDACDLAGTVFGVTTAEAQLFERSEQRVARDAMEHFLVQVFLQGGGTTWDGSHIRAGDMLIIDLAQPHRMVTTDFSNLTLVLPRELNARLSDTLVKLHACKLPKENPLVRMLADHLCSLWNTVGGLSVQDSGAALKGTIGLMDLWLPHSASSRGEAAPEVSVALGRAIARYIDNHIDEVLSPERLVTVFRISRSQLYRIFKPHDGVSRYVWGRRLLKSRRMLANPMFDTISVSAVAFQCGFATEPHFSRSFKERFGVSPSQFRNEARQAGIQRLRANDDQAFGHIGFASWVRELSRN